jgi:hypothetical protein
MLHVHLAHRPERELAADRGRRAGVGVDYGIYHFSRMIDAFDEGRNLDDAVDYATATTGKAIIFTATTMVAGRSSGGSPTSSSRPRWASSWHSSCSSTPSAGS